MDLSILLSAFVISTLLHFGIQRIFIIYKKFDDFNHRSSHNTLATRTGGIGTFATLFLISLYFYLKGIEVFDYSLFIPLGVMFIIGVYDDFYNADFKLKFFLQIIVAKILIDNGFVISNYYGLFGISEIPRLLAQLSTVFVFLVVVNAINFIDGVDGLAISEVIKIIVIIEFLSSNFTVLSYLGFIVITSLLPLYYFNFKKNKKIFLGDGGSLLLGTLVMIYLLHVLRTDYKLDYQINKTLLVIIITLYPLADLLRVFVLRIKSGKSPFIADKNHIHHLINKKFDGNQVKTCISIQFISILIFMVLFTIIK